ncbi:hypothetical protein [Sapientia aquatica]|uniref:Uncharacterized protein n=1 Tax=Sapientia aquatica TaxID=1549640 RepID=A0A4R5W619_9BURK|nr:hypothetical protein [Sapientia aquatica]TDK68537.1 hypothetical protein E2I14_03075 [Sapientia aquatica]
MNNEARLIDNILIGRRTVFPEIFAVHISTQDHMCSLSSYTHDEWDKEMISLPLTYFQTILQGHYLKAGH